MKIKLIFTTILLISIIFSYKLGELNGESNYLHPFKRITIPSARPYFENSKEIKCGLDSEHNKAICIAYLGEM